MCATTNKINILMVTSVSRSQPFNDLKERLKATVRINFPEIPWEFVHSGPQFVVMRVRGVFQSWETPYTVSQYKLFFTFNWIILLSNYGI